MSMRVVALTVFGAALSCRAFAADDPSFYAVNNSNAAIDMLFVEPDDDLCWCGDHLGNQVLRPGDRVLIRPRISRSGSCNYEVKVVYAGGRTQMWRHVDLCKVTHFIFTGDGRGGPRG